MKVPEQCSVKTGIISSEEAGVWCVVGNIYKNFAKRFLKREFSEKNYCLFWKEKYYIPPNLFNEIRKGMTPEIQRIIENLPENKICDECREIIWRCECMVKIDNSI